MAELEVELVATDRLVWSGQAKLVSAPAEEGEIGVLVGHSPLLSVLRAGKVRITTVAGTRASFEVSGGFISVDSDLVTIVADTVTEPGEAHSLSASA